MFKDIIIWSFILIGMALIYFNVINCAADAVNVAIKLQKKYPLRRIKINAGENSEMYVIC